MSMLAVGTLVATGVSMYSANKAGKDAKAAGDASSAQYRKDGEAGARSLDKYRKLLALPGMQNMDAIRANIANLPGISRLTGKVNAQNQVQLDKMFAAVLPGFKGTVNRAFKNTSSWVKGEIPKDVAANVKDRAAERSLNFGFAGSASGKALTARDLGTTSMAIMREGENSLQRWMQSARTYLMPQPLDPTAFFVTPDQQMKGLTAAAGIAESQATLRTGQGNKANEAMTGGALANAAGQRQMYQALGQGIEGAAGAYAGAATTGSGVAGMSSYADTPQYQSYLNKTKGYERFNHADNSGWQANAKGPYA